MKAEQVERERLRDKLAEEVMVLLADPGRHDHRLRARSRLHALERLVGELGLSAGEAGQWCGGLSAREISRMRQLARDPGTAES